MAVLGGALVAVLASLILKAYFPEVSPYWATALGAVFTVTVAPFPSYPPIQRYSDTSRSRAGGSSPGPCRDNTSWPGRTRFASFSPGLHAGSASFAGLDAMDHSQYATCRPYISAGTTSTIGSGKLTGSHCSSRFPVCWPPVVSSAEVADRLHSETDCGRTSPVVLFCLIGAFPTPVQQARRAGPHNYEVGRESFLDHRTNRASAPASIGFMPRPAFTHSELCEDPRRQSKRVGI